MMSGRNRWIICAFIFFATVLNYMDRQTLGILAPLVQEEFRLDNAQLGLLFSAFYISYGVSVALIGEAIDRMPMRLAFALIVGGWSLVTGLTALAQTFWQLMMFRVLLGIGEAGNWPTTARLVSMYIAPGERTLANSIYMGGGSLGLLIVQPLLVWISLRHGWRLGFVVLGLLALFWIVAWLWWFRPKNIAHLERHDTVPAGQESGGWSEVWRLPRFWGLIVASFFGNACLYFLMNWLPTFLVQDRHFAFNLTFGGVIIVPFAGLDAGYILSGTLVLLLVNRGWRVLTARRLVLLAAAGVMAVSMILTPMVSSNVVSLALLFFSTFGMAAWNANYLCFVEELYPKKVSAVSGLIGSAGAFAGAISLWLVGVLSQTFGSFTPAFIMMGCAIGAATAGILLTPEPRKHVESAPMLAEPVA